MGYATARPCVLYVCWFLALILLHSKIIDIINTIIAAILFWAIPLHTCMGYATATLYPIVITSWLNKIAIIEILTLSQLCNNLSPDTHTHTHTHTQIQIHYRMCVNINVHINDYIPHGCGITYTYTSKVFFNK